MSEKPTAEEIADSMAEMVRREIRECSDFTVTAIPQHGETPGTVTLKIVGVLSESQLAEEREWRRNHLEGCAECRASKPATPEAS
jgi:hypothetical protein